MSRALRILHTEAAKGMGGQEIYIFRNMQAMRARGHEVSLLCQPDARLGTLAREHGFTVHTLKMGGLARLVRGIWSVSRLVRRHRYDVVNTTSRRDALIAAAGARLGGTPLVVRSRHLMSPVNSLLTYTGLPHRIITVSSFVKQLLVDRGIDAARIGIVQPITALPGWHHADGEAAWQALQQIRAEVRVELGFSAADTVVGCVAVLRAPKGHADLLQAMAPLCRANPRLQLVIVGDGKAVMDQLLALRAQHGLEAQVHLLGYRCDAARLMAGFDVFALPSHKEAAGTVFLEAAQAGLPIVATRVGGVPEMVVDGSNAILTALGDNDALAGALRLLIDDPQRRQLMGRAGWDWMRAAQRFTADGHAEATEHYYHQWLKELGHG
ncbi:glycosyltransferase family 4 protein [Stenotrophomonas sp. 24(2023)]|uniref:glycosyltransferase family 4 protein n=1 Tax=Stenotrophomonas sp. 24(2023) TaxID=3068324 RepID=UPI0027DF1742|nr:glycosyltransferase family 4 protein [Stenotrophomonas sp. 24(2023)]WMJ69946.1 glycosyltransferase family 4 protein [Stenotrophomonas sp. 24(2023)]